MFNKFCQVERSRDLIKILIFQRPFDCAQGDNSSLIDKNTNKVEFLTSNSHYIKLIKL